MAFSLPHLKSVMTTILITTMDVLLLVLSKVILRVEGNPVHVLLPAQFQLFLIVNLWIALSAILLPLYSNSIPFLRLFRNLM